MMTERKKTFLGRREAFNINKMVSSGCKVKILMADWFAMLNKKMGGDLMQSLLLSFTWLKYGNRLV